jgi:hypothetical protein
VTVEAEQAKRMQQSGEKVFVKIRGEAFLDISVPYQRLP